MSAQSEEFLAHFGVPGMKWGKRKARDDSGGSRSSKSSSSNQNGSAPAKKGLSRNQKVAIGVGVGAVAVVGTALVLRSMNKNMKLPVSALRNNPSTATGQSILSTSLPKAPTPSGTGLSLGSASRFAGKTTPAPAARAATSAASTARRATSNSGFGNSPSLSSLSNIINSAPQIVFDSATGQYVTR